MPVWFNNIRFSYNSVFKDTGNQKAPLHDHFPENSQKSLKETLIKGYLHVRFSATINFTFFCKAEDLLNLLNSLNLFF